MTKKQDTITHVDLYTAGTIAHNLVEGATLQQAGSHLLADSARELANLYATIGGSDLAKAEIRTMLVEQDADSVRLLKLFNQNPKDVDLADEIGFSGEPNTMSVNDVKRAAKNRKDAALTAVRRAFKRLEREVKIGKQRDPAQKSISFPKIKPQPEQAHPAAGKDQSTKPIPTSGEQPQPVEVVGVSEEQQVAMILSAFDALSADQQDEVAAHVLATLESRKGADGRVRGGQIAAAMRKAKAAPQHRATH